MDKATIYLKSEDCDRARLITTAVFLKDKICREDRLFISRLGILLESEGLYQFIEPSSADENHIFLTRDDKQTPDSPELKAVKGAYELINGTADVDCDICDESAEGRIKDDIAICETCHRDEVA